MRQLLSYVTIQNLFEFRKKLQVSYSSFDCINMCVMDIGWIGQFNSDDVSVSVRFYDNDTQSKSKPVEQYKIHCVDV